MSRTDKRPKWLIQERRLMDFLIIYIINGEGVFTCNQKSIYVKGGSLVWFSPNSIIRLEGLSTTMEQIYIHFDLLYDKRLSPKRFIPTEGQVDFKDLNYLIHPKLKHPIIKNWGGLLKINNIKIAQSLMSQISLEHLRGQNPCRSTGLMYQLIAEIQEGLEQGNDQIADHWHPIHLIANKILTNPEKELDVKELAAECKLSESHFRKLFKETQGKSPRELHQHAKIQKACEWLLYSTWNITEIALHLSYSNVHNFSRAFKHMIGISPLDYRKRGGEN